LRQPLLSRRAGGDTHPFAEPAKGRIVINWARIVSKITGGVDQHLLDRNEYLLAENRVMRERLDKRLRLSDRERIMLAKAAKPIGRSLLADIATLATPDTLLRWHRKLVEKKQSTTAPDAKL
jgi:putative transposase